MKIDHKLLSEKYLELPTAEKREIQKLAELTYHSCGIEGNTLTEKEMFFLCLHSHFKEKDDR